MKQTGYERTGFDGIHLCGDGVYNDKHHDCEPVNQEQVESSKKWLEEYARPAMFINTRHSSHGLKHYVEDEVHKYITNGAFCRAAIEEGYQYIIDHQSNHIYLNIIVTGKHKCEEACLSDGYCNPIDQEDYTHAIRTIVDSQYALNNRKRWRKLLDSLLHDSKHYEWWDPWHRLILYDDLEKVNPFLRMIIANIMSVITAIYLNGSDSLFSMNLDIYEKLTISINPTSYNFNDNEVKESYPDLYELYSPLPIHFRIPNWTNGCCDGLTLPKAEILVEYMLSDQFQRIMLKLFGQEEKFRPMYEKVL
ncbi:MAG: hypothetical protein WAM14_14085 [Candidatus Nitrosopolaris sp.]